MTRVGAVDIGTNTVRLLVADVHDGVVTDLVRESRVVGLGTGVDASGRFDPGAVQRASAALADFGGHLDRHHVRARRAVATSASRDAADADEALAGFARLIGVTPEVITGSEEASLSFRGAVAGASPGVAPVLVIDPGGGSTELVVGSTKAETSVSIDMGSVRLTERILRDRPAPADQVMAARALVADMFRDSVPVPPALVIGVGGTFTSLAALHLGVDVRDRDRVHGTHLTAADLDAAVTRLAAMSIAETEAIASLDPGRAPVILAGAVVAAEALRAAGAGDVLVSECDLLDGIALGLAD